MGSNPTISSFEDMNWRFVQQNDHITILFNDSISKSIQKHQATIDCDSQYINQIFQWRSHLSPQQHIVQLFQYGVKEGGICNGNSQTYTINERIHKFSQLPSITQPQSFLLIKHIIKGLTILFQKFGTFTPYSKLFGINSEGIGKIWINQNFAECQPQKSLIPTQQSQLAIVNSLVRLISQKVYIQQKQQLVSYPFNLNFKETVKYIDGAIQKIGGFYMRKIYKDRQQYHRHHCTLEQSLLKQAKGNLILLQAQKKLNQIQNLKLMLQQQQIQLARKQNHLMNSGYHLNSKNNITSQNNIVIPQNIPNSNSHHRSDSNHIISPQKNQQSILKYQKNQYIQPIYQQNINRTPEFTNHISPKKVLKNTTSTNNSGDNHPIVTNYQPQIHKNQISNNVQIKNNIIAHQFPPHPYPQQRKQTKKYKEQMKNKQINNNNMVVGESLKRNIQMVDSMLLIGNDQMSDKNKKFIDSRDSKSRQGY